MFDTVIARDRRAPHSVDLLVERLLRDARRVAEAQAEMYASMLAVAKAASDDPEVLDEFASDEVRALLMLTRRAAGIHVDLAWQLCARLPAVWSALHTGEIDLARARVIIDLTTHLDDHAAREIAGKVLVGAGEWTTGQLRARLKRMVIEFDSEAEMVRYESAVEQRRVTIDSNEDGTATLHAWNIPADRAQAAMRVVNATARSLKTAADTRTADQMRADVFTDLLCGGGSAVSVPRAGVDIRVDLTTLLGFDEKPAELPGWGPVIADVARRVVAEQSDALWEFTVVNSDTGVPVWAGTTRRRPTVGQARSVRARNQHCVFPGCRMPAVDCDLDHTKDYAKGGPTEPGNSEPLCRHDHLVKHKGGWLIERIGDGAYKWTSRLGQTYTTYPRGP